MSTDSLQENGVLKNGSPEEIDRDQVTKDEAVAEQVMEVSATNPLLRAALIVVAMATAFAIAFWGIHSLQSTDPYVQSVLQISGDPARGREIFALNCATCHGLEAAGEVGPDLSNVSERKSRVALIEQVISGRTPPMPQFQPNEKDMADLLSFLETL